MNKGEKMAARYSDTTELVFQDALNKLAKDFPAEVVARLKRLLEEGRLHDPDAVAETFQAASSNEQGG